MENCLYIKGKVSASFAQRIVIWLNSTHLIFLYNVYYGRHLKFKCLDIKYKQSDEMSKQNVNVKNENVIFVEIQ